MKVYDEDDPMELQGIEVTGVEMEFQARALIEEFLSVQLSGEELMSLFRSPFYIGTHHLYLTLGEEKIAQLIEGYTTSETISAR